MPDGTYLSPGLEILTVLGVALGGGLVARGHDIVGALVLAAALGGFVFLRRVEHHWRDEHE